MAGAAARPASDGDQLRLLAELFDGLDNARGVAANDAEAREVQADLRRIAARLDAIDGRSLPTADDVAGILGALATSPEPAFDEAAVQKRLADLHIGEPEGWHNPRDAVDGGHGER